MNLKINTDFSNISEMPLFFWILLAVILFSQAVWLFQDAGKRNANKWLWGLWGLIQAPTPLIVYIFVVRKFLGRNNKEKRIRFIVIALCIFAIASIIGIKYIFFK